MEILEILKNFGLPVACLFGMVLMVKYVYDTCILKMIEHEKSQNDVLINENMKRLEQLTLAVNNNTETISQLVANLTSDDKLKEEK